MKTSYIVNNYHSFISVPSEDETRPIYFEAGELNNLKPFIKKLTLDQIQFINLRSDLFKTGRLEFNEEDEKDLFEYLDITDESQVFRAEEILDTIKNPTKAKLERVVEIRDLNTIDLFRGILTSLKNIGEDDISNRVIITINQRRDEIYKNPTEKSKIVVKKTNEEVISEKAKAEQDMVKSLEQRIKELEAKLTEKPKSTPAKKTNKEEK